MIHDLNIIFQRKVDKSYLFHVIVTSSTYGCVAAGYIVVNLERNISRWSGSNNFISESDAIKLVNKALEEAKQIADVIS